MPACAAIDTDDHLGTSNDGWEGRGGEGGGEGGEHGGTCAMSSPIEFSSSSILWPISSTAIARTVINLGLRPPMTAHYVNARTNAADVTTTTHLHIDRAHMEGRGTG